MKIIILSCQKFSDLWSNNIYLLNKYWINHPDYIISTDEYGIFDLKNNENIKIFKGNMSDRLIEAVKSIDDDYIFLTFDDYLICKNVNFKYINDVEEEMREKNFSYCRFFKNKKVKGKKNKYLKYKKLLFSSVYEVNFYPSIWKKDSLLSVLHGNEDIWKTEARLTRRMKENRFTGIAIYNKNIFPFVDTIRKGKYLRKPYRFLEKNKLFISNREKRTFKEDTYLFIQTTASSILPKFVKNIIKDKLRKKGRIFYSDYANTND